MAVRDATEADVAAICSIYNHEIENETTTFETEPWSPATQLPWFQSHQTPMLPLLVAQSASGGVVGWAALSRWSPRSGYDGTVELSVFVERSQRRSGVARQLLQILIDRAREIGHRVILGRIEAGNDASRRLLTQMGFTSVGVMHAVGLKFGQVLDVELLELVLLDQNDYTADDWESEDS